MALKVFKMMIHSCKSMCSLLKIAISFAFISNGLGFISKSISFSSPCRITSLMSTLQTENQADIIIIGSGISGLSCGALLAHAGYSVVVFESHDAPGGCAHGWERLGYHFESGPSLYGGLSPDKSPNPLKKVFQIIEEEPHWLTYDRWGSVLPEGTIAPKIGPEEFDDVLMKLAGQDGVNDWHKLIDALMGPNGLSEAAQATPSLALREDAGAIITLLKYWKGLLKTLSKASQLNKPFSSIRDEIKLTNPFVLNWLDFLCFCLQGQPVNGTLNAVIAYMIADWYRPGATLDFPEGGSSSIVNALVRGIEKKGGKLLVNKHVEQVLISSDGSCAEGVIVRNQRGGQMESWIANRAVVSNVDSWNTKKMIPIGKNKKFDETLNEMIKNAPPLASFIHLHAGIDATGLPTEASADFPTQWAVVKDWNLPKGVEAPRNLVLVSMPSLIDRTLAPPGKHVIHAYVPATEPYEWWEGLDRKSEEYTLKKKEAADFLWDAVEKYVPNARLRSDKRVEQIGTPLTHERFLRRSMGTYGPRVVAGEGTLPGHRTPLKKFWMTGDFTFPGIGVPAAAASGAITANSIMMISEHLLILKKVDPN